MTTIIDRIQSVRNKLDSFENIDQVLNYISTLSSDEKFALNVALKSWENLKLFIADRDDVDDELMSWLRILGRFLTVPDEDRKKESKERIKTRKEKYESTIKTYQQVKEDPVLKDFLIKDLKLLKKLLVNQRMLIELKNKRVRDLTEIKRYLKPIVKYLKERGWNKTQQTDFFYDLFYSFDYDNCRNIDPKSYKKKLWMMIHRL